jgi:hypothetical protein
MSIKPIAIGTEVVPTCRPDMNFVIAGAKYPIPMPRAIAMNMMSVKYLSSRERLFLDPMVYSSSNRIQVKCCKHA